MKNKLINIIKFLNSKEIDAWVSGGTARDIYLNKKFKNLDISVKTSISQVKEIFGDRIVSFNQYNNSLTVNYLNTEYILYPLQKVSLENTYPIYSPTDSLEEDAQSKDFTINSLYYNPITEAWLDYFGGKKDADNKVIKFIGNWQTKILESKIRIIRASILKGILGEDWSLDYKTSRGISNYSLKIAGVGRKALHKEISKIFLRCKKPSVVFDSFKETNVLRVIFPELTFCIGLDQSAKTTHYLDLYQHTMFALDSVSATSDNSELVRVAALLHDIAKPCTETYTDKGRHFYNHEVIGKTLSEQILYRWGYSESFRKKVGLLVFHHLYNIKSTDSKTAIKKFIARVTPELIHSVLDLRIADINGVPQSKSLYQVNNLRRKINEELSTISPENTQLAISDEELSEILEKYTEANLVAESVKKSKKYLIAKIFLGRVYNKKPNLKKLLKQVLEINCPLDKPHLLSTWENLQTGNAETFKNGKLKCGIYCGFNCDKKLSK